ncbi:MAG: hydrogenase formation protein HypD [Deferribacteraceae bacterium]|jgi:hydrogenase expression/formation protein HypD|nr:hydrogenase formation protein HypD [Deferribacteraceae bacterium]
MLNDIFNGKEAVSTLVQTIRKEASTAERYRIMEICGTHTMSIARYGIPSLLPDNVELVSGPGCPVCVTAQEDIDYSVALANKSNLTLAAFGDMMKLRDSNGFSLLDARAGGADILIVYSPLDILEKAKQDRQREFAFIGVGFETTAPIAAALIKNAAALGIDNITLLPLLKTMPQVIDLLLNDENIKIDGFLCPGNLAVITGTAIFERIVEAGRAAVISGFEAADILSSILLIIRQVNSSNFKVQNNYLRACHEEGSAKAQKILKEVFKPLNVSWRGLGEIVGSGLTLNDNYSHLDARTRFNIPLKTETSKNTPCRCGDILKGYIKPDACPLFSKLCTPDNPYGACMVSSEGACAAYYKYVYAHSPDLFPI